MLKWLEKVFAPTPESAPTPPAAEEKQRPVETPLPPPRVDLGRTDEDDGNGFVARQAIISRDYRLVGYEFTMRDRTRSRISLDQQSQKINDQLLLRAINSLGIDKLSKYRQLWVSVVDVFITSPMVETLPAQATVLVLRLPAHAASVESTLLARARELKLKGYKLALAGWAESPAHQLWLALADYVVIDTATYNPAEVGELARQIVQRAVAVEVLAQHVESFEEFEFCHRAQYQLFQGAFLTKRDNWPPQPKMSPDRVRICDLLNRLRAGEEIVDIAGQLRQSPELTYRLLRYINSAGMGLQHPVASIEQGLVFLGREKLYRWLTLLLFNADSGRSTDAALLEQALVRGRMMEILSAEKFSRLQSDEVFVVGIFSLLDILLKLPMSVALNPLQLPPPVAGALIDDSGAYAPYLRLAVACEAHDDTTLAAAAAALGLAVDRVNSAQFEALAWAQDTLSPAAGP